MPLIQQKRRNLAPEHITRIKTISIIKLKKKSSKRKNRFYKHLHMVSLAEMGVSLSCFVVI
jgi:hypothetical protein